MEKEKIKEIGMIYCKKHNIPATLIIDENGVLNIALFCCGEAFKVKVFCKGEAYEVIWKPSEEIKKLTKIKYSKI